jgi:hypothetical protein
LANDWKKIRAILISDPHIYALFVSPTGEGIKAIYRVPICRNAAEYKLAFVAVAARVRELTGVEIDKLADFTRLCFASYDSDAHLNHEAIELPVDFSQPAEQPVPTETKTSATPPSVETRRAIAERHVGEVEWDTDILGHCKCPGEAQHTAGESPRECRIYLDGVPTIYCLHKSCAAEIVDANKELRNEIFLSENHTLRSSAGNRAGSKSGLREEYIGGGESPCPPVQPALSAPTAKRLDQLVAFVANDPSELLRHRYLCLGGGLLLVGPTGIGKSSFSMQAMILWAIGRAAFAIKPARPLKSLLIQAENDDGDLAEMRDGVIAGLNLTDIEKQSAMANVIVAREDTRTGMVFFAGTVRPLLAEHRPDLLWIDPALSYLGAEANSQKDVGGFLRNQLNPLLREFNCGAVVVHHTNKPASGREKPDWSGGDFAYLGGGSAEWANWARAVIAIRSLGSHSVFEVRAAKRGGRLGWTEADGVTKAYAKLIAHATEPGVICWRDANISELPEAGGVKRTCTKVDVLVHVPPTKPMAKDELRALANSAGVALNKINSMIAELVADGALFEWHEKRPRTNDKILFARVPQPQGGTV